jgi:FkbM family methyltransferase
MFNHLKKYLKKPPKNNDPYVIKGTYEIYYKIFPHSALDFHIVKHGIIQDWIVTKLNQLIDDEGIVFDIGANVGLMTLPFAKKHVTNGFVYAFEPDEENFKQLKDNIKLNKLTNVFASQIAIQDEPSLESITFFKRRSIDDDKLTNRGLSTLEKMDNHNISEHIVSSSTIDIFVEKNNISRIDFIKIDVEGSEFRVLNGGIKSLEIFKPIILYEYSTIIDKLSKSENTIKSFNLLKKFGYIQFKIFDEKFLIEINQFDLNLESTNVIAFHKSKIPKKLSEFMKN